MERRDGHLKMRVGVKIAMGFAIVVLIQLAMGVFSQAKIRKKSCKNPNFIFGKSEKNHGSFLPHEGMFHTVAFPLKQ